MISVVLAFNKENVLTILQPCLFLPQLKYTYIFWIRLISLFHKKFLLKALSVISTEYYISLAAHSVSDFSHIDAQINESVILSPSRPQ